MKIAICITTRNREEITNACLFNWIWHMPKNAKLFIVDDASEKPYKMASFRFEKQAGIARAKNKCLQLAQNFDYIFLADNDVCPTNNNWHLPYINSGLNHAMYIFDRNKTTECQNYIEYDKPRGVLLFLKKEVLKVVGGMDEDFGVWGFEHANYSDRIFNAGLTPARYLDAVGDKHFYCFDQNSLSDISTVPSNERAMLIPVNEKLYQQKYYSKEFKPFK